jgi:two-component system, sensor histidine kinase
MFTRQALLVPILEEGLSLMADPVDDSVKLALLAHDLRTPLAAMHLTAELIGNGSLDVAQAEQLSTLIRSIDALTQMTTELLSAAEPGAGAEQAWSRVAEIVGESADLFSVAAEAKDLSFNVSIDATARGCISAQGGALRRVIASLLDNAIKYTPEGGVEVGLKLLQPGEIEGSSDDTIPWVCVSVLDSGPGIDREEQARLFRPFVRGQHGRNTVPGTGLGLWGTAQLVSEMGGRLLLGQPETGGSRFDVQIPVALEGTERQPLTKETSVSSVADLAGRLPGHVLIVDDNDTNCRLLAALLESFGVTSEIAKSGEQAIGFVQKASFEAVLLDLNMPGMSGLETAEELRNLRTESDLPLIAVTAALESIGDKRLRQAGFQDVLTKPLSPAALYEALEHARRLRDESHPNPT